MDSPLTTIDFGPAVKVTPVAEPPSVIVVCEHASNRIPDGLNDLGLDQTALSSHIAWDPGAREVAEAVAHSLSAGLVCSTVSRLVYDCNRPPEAESAIPRQSEIYAIPGNENLTPEARADRIEHVYRPFERALADEIARHRATLGLLVTIHSFTPVFHGAARSVELGILHGEDDRFATAMMQHLPDSLPFTARLNEPYAPADGVMHTLDLHGAANGLRSVMIEVRNDLIATGQAQKAMAGLLADWINATRFAGGLS